MSPPVITVSLTVAAGAQESSLLCDHSWRPPIPGPRRRSGDQLHVLEAHHAEPVTAVTRTSRSSRAACSAARVRRPLSVAGDSLTEAARRGTPVMTETELAWQNGPR